ncbi:hypothetical protein KP509_02G033400 [Ceratopteris richardii]|uniref:GBF-interacting protein 1 N-terminal domain-containing protein n=1 Tax=Ceratopteris richardii TaxID=49495 RepID=A0A8T2VBR6_CERRI|nr:hypothetical protein KP509_02G033400 [Ceratopteris richardii]
MMILDCADTFHEVKRKRDKKKENANKEVSEGRSRTFGTGSSMRGGRARARGNYGTRYNSEFSNGGRGQSFGGRDGGNTQQNGRNSNQALGVTMEPEAFSKPVIHVASDISTATGSGMTATPSGSSQYAKVGAKATFGIGQATMADIVKSTSVNHNAVIAPVKVTSQQPLHPPDSTLSSSSDPVLHSYDSLEGKQNIGSVVFERSVREISPSATHVEAIPVSASDSSDQAPQFCEAGSYRLDSFTSAKGRSGVDTEIPSTSGTSSLAHELVSSLDLSAERSTVQPSASSEILSSRAPLNASSLLNGRVYQGQTPALGSEKGSNLEWRPKSPGKGSSSFKSFDNVGEVLNRPASSQENMELFRNSTTKLEQLSIHEDQPVIIPDHLQVPEADRTHLSFGSFGDDFESTSNYVDEEDDKKSSGSVEDNLHEKETTTENLTPSSLTSSSVVPSADSYKQQPMPSRVETFAVQEDVKINIPAQGMLPMSQPAVSKPDILAQQSAPHTILSSTHGYTGSGAAPQLTSGPFMYDAPDSQAHEASRATSFMSYSDPNSNVNYYNPAFRPSLDMDGRYTQFASTASNKYNAGIPQVTGQSLTSSQEGANSMVLPATGGAGQTSQTVGLSQSTLTLPQQHIPIQAYPSQHTGLPINPFGANVFGIHFVPQSYGYTPPYQHSYSGHGHTPVPQAPDIFFAPGSSFGATAYPSAGAVPMKYAFSQYKPGGAATGSVPHTAVAAGYGNFSTSPSGFTTINSAVTSATASGYEEASGPQYKENNLFIPNQQPAQGSGVWIQNPPSRDMTGMQTNSYYNLLGQGQHTSFTHTTPMHAVPVTAYASLYNQSQSGSAPAVHQLLQQPQALGAVGGVASQSGTYQQQRQLNWPLNY